MIIKSSAVTVREILSKFPEYTQVTYNGVLLYDDNRTTEETDEKHEKVDNLNEVFLDKYVSNFSVNIINEHYYIIKIFGDNY